MQKIPKCKTKFIIPQPNYLKISKKEQQDDTINNGASKISQKKLKFTMRHFGKDITNSIKENVQNNLIEASMKSISIDKINNNSIYIKKHSSVSQVNQKEQNSKIQEKKMIENKSGIMISKKAHSTSVFTNNKILHKHGHITSEMNNKNNKKSTKLHNAISFGCNNVSSEQLNDGKFGSVKNMSLNINNIESVSKDDLNNHHHNRDLM